MLCAYSFAQTSGGGELGTDLEALHASEEFRVALEAYNRNAFNEAIYSFEHALTFKPEEPLILDWLGRAYYRSGMETIALRQWQAASDAYGLGTPQSVLVRSRIETVRARRSMFRTINGDNRYVEIGNFTGTTNEGIFRFSQPASVLPERDGSFWAVCYGSNEIVKIDVNGVVRQRERGPLAGFDRPFDIVRGIEGNFYVSEFRGGRVSVFSSDGKWQGHISGKGIADGLMVGAANMAVDEEGYLYVVEYGNQRISKFAPNGEFIYNFGKKDGIFGGFLSPTGIACKNGMVYAADSIAKSIYIFDSNGNYIDVLLNSGLDAPEAMHFLDDGTLLISDTKKLLSLELDSTILSEISRSSNINLRYLDARVDFNGNILSANFNSSEIAAMAPIDDVASGFFVQIDRVISRDFPKITVELTVQNTSRHPITGLDFSNFSLSEAGRPVGAQEFLGTEIAQKADIAVLLERSFESKALQTEFVAALRDINAALPGSIEFIISSGTKPFMERFNAESEAALAQAARGGSSTYSERWRFDSGLRLAATQLLPMSKKRAVVFVSSGTLGELSYEQYSLSEMAAYLANNGIVFYVVLAGSPDAEDGLKYLCSETGGAVMRLYSPQGIAPVLQTINTRSGGTYVLSYTSGLSTDFGKAFLPLEAEVQLLDRSGRDAVGYFAPLE
ncbi:MAG: hypothetical protein Ta2G_17330 [Termitinemataceae bacterium]|nr:MAG: hypothetical protein Ta2G_17330 [Termitinemataceae bacterium]